MTIMKVLSFATIITLSLGLSSCNLNKATRFSRDDGIIADTRFQKIIEAIDEKDKEGLRKMFSPQALKEAKDIDGGIDYIMEFYKGNLESKERALQVDDSSNYGENTSDLKCFYRVTTDADKYIVFFIEQIVDDKNPNNVGLYMLQIIKLADREKEFDWGSKTRCAGIYRPAGTKN